MTVVDASALVAWLLQVQPWELRIESRVGQLDIVHAPHLIDLEVLQALRRSALRNEASDARLAAAVRDFATMRLVRYPHEPFLERIWQLRHNLTAYDAAYVALAEALDAPLLTLDQRLAGSSGHNADIELL